MLSSPSPDDLERKIFPFYRQVLVTLTETGLPFLVGGAFALHYYTGIVRHTKDLDIFVRPEDCPRALERLAAQGYRTELTDHQWLAKAFADEEYVDFIFASGKGLGPVDAAWFEHAVAGDVLGLPVKLCSAEEMLWSKALIMERERYDGADMVHLIRACGPKMDWHRLLERFAGHWRVLFSHLILFGFVYPNERSQVPDWLLSELVRRLQDETSKSASSARICRGTLLSHTQYLVDIEWWGYQDGRLTAKEQTILSVQPASE